MSGCGARKHEGKAHLSLATALNECQREGPLWAPHAVTHTTHAAIPSLPFAILSLSKDARAPTVAARHPHKAVAQRPALPLANDSPF